MRNQERLGGRSHSFQQWALNTLQGSVKCSLEAELLWLHNLPCERGWLLPISTDSFQLGHFLLPSSPPHFLQVASVIQLALGEASCAHAPNPKMAGLTLTCRMTLQRRQGLLCLLTPGSHFQLFWPKWKKCVCVYARPFFHKACHCWAVYGK